jgi:DNA primase
VNKPNPDLQHELAEKLNRVQWHGHYFGCLCAFHDDHKPSMFVYDNGFRCSSCNVFGSLEYLSSKINHSVIQYKPEEKSNIQDKPNWNLWLKKYGSYGALVKSALETAQLLPSTIAYIRTRGLWDLRNQFGFADGFILVPVYNATGRLVDVVARTTPYKQTSTKYFARPRQSDTDYHLLSANWKRVEESDYAVFYIAGVFDVFSFEVAEIPAITGLQGKSMVRRYAELLKDIRKKIYIITDVGEEKEGIKLQQMLGWRGKLLRPNMRDSKDANEILVKYGADALKELIK